MKEETAKQKDGELGLWKGKPNKKKENMQRDEIQLRELTKGVFEFNI